MDQSSTFMAASDSWAFDCVKAMSRCRPKATKRNDAGMLRLRDYSTTLLESLAVLDLYHHSVEPSVADAKRNFQTSGVCCHSFHMMVMDSLGRLA